MTHNAEDSLNPLRFDLLSLLRLLLLIGLATLVLPVSGLGTRTVEAQQRSVAWERFDVRLDLREDGTFHVAERQQIAFDGGPFRGAFREIPIARMDDIGNVQVSAVNGETVEPFTFVSPGTFSDVPGTYTYRQTASNLKIDWGFDPATSETRTFVIEYDVVGALRVYLDAEPPYQQISWIAVPSGLTDIGPVEEATMTMRLPVAVDPAQTEISPGDDPADHTENGQVWTWETSDLGKGDSFETGLRFPPIVAVGPPSWQEASDIQETREMESQARGDILNLVFIGAGLLLTVGGGLGVYGLWYTRGRDPHTGLVADFLPQPPDDLPPGAAGTLLDERADDHDVIATLVDLGHRDVIKIDETQSEGFFGIGGSRDFELTLRADDPATVPFERALLHALFGSRLEAGKTTKLSQVKERVAMAQASIKEDLYAELVRRGYFLKSPESTRSRWSSVAKVIIFLAVGSGFILVGAFADIAPLVWFPIIVVAGLALLLMAVSGALPRKTEAGAEAAARWRAFRKYLESIEKYEKLDEAREIFDRYLPYAVAFGLERSWVQKFANVQAPTPGLVRRRE